MNALILQQIQNLHSNENQLLNFEFWGLFHHMIDMQFDWEGLLFEQCHYVHWQCVIVGIHGNNTTCVFVQTCECSWVHLFLFERAFLNIDNRFTRLRLLLINFRIERTQGNFPKNGFVCAIDSGTHFLDAIEILTIEFDSKYK